MTIKQKFNGFYHAILTEAYDKAREISFRQWKDTNSKGCLIFYKDEDYDQVAYTPKFNDQGEEITIDRSLKTIFKLMNVDYPLTDNEEGKTSTTDITDLQLSQHITWITKILNENGIEFQHDIDEWERLKMEAGIYE